MFLEKKYNLKRGFTLIELLVVIAIISLLSSVILTNLATSRLRAADAKKVSEFRNITTALNLYYDTYGTYPNEGSNVATNPYFDNFNSMVTQLVSAGLLGSVPVSPGSNNTYEYYNYGRTNAAGAVTITHLQSVAPTIVPPYSSCRPFGSTDWCSNATPSNYYCVCNPY